MKEDHDYISQDWKDEVANSETRLGWKDWLEHKLLSDQIAEDETGIAAMRLIQNINWEKLKAQKTALLEVFAEGKVDGLINLLDAIQDFAVSELGVPEEKVFQLDEEK